MARGAVVLVPVVALVLTCWAGADDWAKTFVAAGWHPWYEVKADPEDQNNLIICGMKWDAVQNAFFGIVYASSDGGATWHTVLEDKSSEWVSEQSCAFGTNHQAYFISEASKVIDGQAHHDLGTTRLFVSRDAGLHWVEATKTVWADYSTSAVSANGRLYTFFSPLSSPLEQRDFGKKPDLQRNIALLVFSPDGEQVAGPFVDSAMRAFFYQSVFSSNAVALKNGSVIALYYGKSLMPSGWRADLGIVRASGTAQPVLESRVVAHPVMDWARDCGTLFDNSLAYDAGRNRLFLVYVEECTDTSQLIFTSSDDEGNTWSKSVTLLQSHDNHRRAHAPSLVVTPDGRIGLLWQDGEDRRSGRWLFSYIREQKLVEPPIELSHDSERYEVSDDSLRTGLNHSETAVSVNVFSQLNGVWNRSALVATSEKVIAVWPFGNSYGTHLYAADLAAPASTLSATITPFVAADRDITGQVVLLFRSQEFDHDSSALRLCLSLKNRSNDSVRPPIILESLDIRSAAGPVTILNAANGLKTSGAVWNISNAVTGDRLPPGAISNAFCLSFHLDLHGRTALSPHEAGWLLNLRAKVMASGSAR